MGHSYYATPYELRSRPWSLDFTPDDAGNPPFPLDEVVNPYPATALPLLEWTTDDWDPALRFWALPFDQQLTRWASGTDASRPSIMAALEFGGTNSTLWQDPQALVWLEPLDLAWRPDPALRPSTGTNAVWEAEKNRAWSVVRTEIEELQQLMQDDRENYLGEIEAQADGLADYMIAYIGASQGRHPWTIELVNCGLAIGNVAYLFYKQKYKRVRPSFLCPGLTPAFGPPAHPAFPSGHSFLGHFIALLLLEIPGLRARYGVFEQPPIVLVPSTLGRAPLPADLAGTLAIPSPLLWLAARLAKNRERLGVHYASDSSASRHIAAGIWQAMLYGGVPIRSPTLDKVLRHAKAEWP